MLVFDFAEIWFGWFLVDDRHASILFAEFLVHDRNKDVSFAVFFMKGMLIYSFQGF